MGIQWALKFEKKNMLWESMQNTEKTFTHKTVKLPKYF